MARFSGTPVDEAPVPKAPGMPAVPPRFGGTLVEEAPAAAPHGGVNAWLPESIRGYADAADDFGTSLSKGMVGLGEAAVGLGNIVSGGGLGNLLEEHLGWDPAKRRQELESEATPGYQAAQQAVRGAQGFGDTLRQLRQNPSVIPHAVAEALPGMALGGVVGRGVGAGAQLLGRSAGIAAPAIGEGVVGAGQQAERIRQETGTLDLGGTAAALGTGAATGLLGAAGAKLGRMFGIADIDAQLAGQRGAEVARGLVNRVLGGGGLESVEEMGQSSVEQLLGNIATGKPWAEGIGQAAAMGGVVGGAMGGAAGVRRPQVAGAPVVDQQAPAAPAVDAQQAPATVGQQQPLAPTVPTLEQAAPTPFAGSQDITPLLDKLNVQGDQRAQTLDLLRPVEQDVEASRRGVVSISEQKKLASLIGLDGAQALTFERKIGQGWNAEETRAVLDSVRGSIESTLSQQARIISGQANDVEKAAFVAQVRNMQKNFGELAGARAEAGRSLAAYRNEVRTMAEAQAILDSVGGAQTADDLAKAMGKALQAGGPLNVAKVIRKGEGFWSKVFGDYLRAAWLSSPTTHVINSAGNSIVMANEVIERTVQAAIGAGKRAVGARGETVFAEPLAMLIGTLKAQGPAIKAAGKSFITGESTLLGGSAKRESANTLRNLHDLSAFDPRTQDLSAVAKRVADQTVLLPFRALTAEDAYFAQVNYAAELRSLAARQARAEKTNGALPTGTKMSTRIEEIVANPSPELIEQAGNAARTRTFNSKAGGITQAVMTAKQGAPWLNIVVPFVKTPSLLIRYATARSPAAPLLSDVRADFREGGAKQEAVIARAAWGTTMLVTAGMLASAGYITGGGPESERERKALMATGWRPYSIKLPDGSYVPYQRLDPFASVIGMGADLATGRFSEKDATATDKVGAVLGAAASNITSKSWLTGLTDLLQFLENPKQNAQWYVSKTVGSLVQPFALFARGAGMEDPYVRQPTGVLESIQQRTPGLRDDLLARIDDWGHEVPNLSSGLGALFNPAPASPPVDDPVIQEAARLGYAPPTLGKSISSGGKQYDLTPEQRHEYRRAVGRRLHILARRGMASPGWRRLTDERKVEWLEKQQRKARGDVKVAMLPYLSRGDRSALDRLNDRTDAAMRQIQARTR